MRMHTVVLSIAVAVLSACASVPLPDNLDIIPPSPSLAPELAAFSGIWEGRWDNGRASRFAVERINANSALVVYAWDHYHSRFYYYKGGWRRFIAKVSGGQIELGTPPNEQFSFRMSEDRTTVRGERVATDGVKNTVVMRKVTPPAK